MHFRECHSGTIISKHCACISCICRQTTGCERTILVHLAFPVGHPNLDSLLQGPPRKPSGAPWAFGKLLQQQQSQQQQQQQQPQQSEQQQQQRLAHQPLIQDVTYEQPGPQSTVAEAGSSLPISHLKQKQEEACDGHVYPDMQCTDSQSVHKLYDRVEALESSSKRIEAKVDKILDYCQRLAGGL